MIRPLGARTGDRVLDAPAPRDVAPRELVALALHQRYRGAMHRELPGVVAALLVALFAPSQSLANQPGTPAGASAACTVPPSITPEEARPVADAFFARGKALREEGKIAEACACLDASNRVAPGRGGTLLTLGLCREQEGKLAEAYRVLNRALVKAKEDGRADREALTNEHLAALAPKLAWISVVLPSNASATRTTVLLDGTPVERETLAALPVDPGKHVVSIAAEGFTTRTIEVAAAAGERHSLAVETLERAPTRAAASPARAPRTPAPAPSAPPRREASNVSSRRDTNATRTAALVAGIAGAVVSLGAGAWALERKSAVRSSCDENKRCDADGLDAASTGRALVAVGTGAFVVGALGFGAWLLLPSGTAPHDRSTGGMVSARGVF